MISECNLRKILWMQDDFKVMHARYNAFNMPQIAALRGFLKRTSYIKMANFFDNFKDKQNGD